MTQNESIEKLMAYQQDLIAEEECLQKLINKINDQAHALQVEQMHILNLINKSSQTSNETETRPEINLKKETVDPESQELDLTIPNYQSSEEDDDEMEE